MKIIYFNRNLKAGYSINKVTKAVTKNILDNQVYYVPRFRAMPIDLIKNLLFVFKRSSKHAINHITGDIHYCMLSLIGVKSVLTIHDTVSVDFVKQGWLKRKYTEWLWFRLPLIIATKVVCITDETKKHVQKYTHRNDIITIHNALDPIFHFVPKDYVQTPYHILFIGTSQNKNLEKTVKALSGINCKLTIIGQLSESQITYLRESRILYDNKTDLTDSEILDEYIKTDIVSFISLFEGFGMPIIEANKVGRPVITSNIPVIKEVAGGAAIMVDPENIEEMHDGFVKLFTDSSLRKACVLLGLKNAQRFDINTLKTQWESLYNSIK